MLQLWLSEKFVGRNQESVNNSAYSIGVVAAAITAALGFRRQTVSELAALGSYASNVHLY